MPKPTHLKVIEDSLRTLPPPIAPNPNYFLFMLGTDTRFTPMPTKESKDVAEQKYYENGETLSYMAQVISDRLEEKPESRESKVDQPLAFSTSSVDLLNGPTTLGSEVGELIAQGLFLILKALAEGKTNIHISGHSRGAVESILIAHELERIKEELIKLKDNHKKTLFEILKSSPCPYTKAAVPKLFKEINESPEVRATLASRFSTAKINMFLLDPVPGGNYRGLPLAWRDDRFYNKIPCNSVEYYIARDERTRCFKAIVPAEVTPILIPGHHGTMSGNLYSQGYTPIPEIIKNRDSSSVQHLILGKFLNFFNKSTRLFDRRHETIALSHPVLDRTTNVFLASDKAGRSRQLLELCQTVQKNDEGLKFFSNTSYPLGREESASRSRLVHYRAHNSMGIDTIFPGLDGEFINADHALLYLHDQMSFVLDTDEAGPDVLITGLSLVLNNMFTEYANRTNPKIRALLDTESSRRITFQALGIFIDTISQKYLRNHLSLDIKTRLLAELDNTFKALNIFKKPGTDPINKIIDECESILRLGIKNTAETHYRALKDQTNRLNKQLKYFLISNEEFELVYTKFLRALDQKIIGEGPLPTLLRIVRTELGNIFPISVSGVRTVINNLLTRLAEDSSRVEVLDILTQLVADPEYSLDRYIDEELLDQAEFLAELNRLHDNIDSLINGKAHVRELVGREALAIDDEQLIQDKDRIIKLAAEILFKKNVDLHIKPDSMSSAFFTKAKAQAIALGAVNPDLIDLQIKLGVLSHEHGALTTAYKEVVQELTDLRRGYESTRRVLGEREQELTTLKQEHEATRQVLGEREQELTTLKQEHEATRQVLGEKEQELTTLQKEHEATRQVLGEKEQELTVLKQDHFTLQQEHIKLQRMHEELQKQNAINRDQIKEDLTKQREIQAQIIEQLGSPKELACANFIMEKLIPVTQDYLDHLTQEAQKLNSSFTRKDSNNLSLFTGKETDKEMYNKVITKYNVTEKLLINLTDNKTTPLPSERIFKFTESLRDTNAQLKEHRDSVWINYFKISMISIAVVCSGIIPGIIVLLAYSAYSGKSPLFFTQSKGEQFVDTIGDSFSNANRIGQ